MSITWSNQQKAIFDFFAQGDGNLVVRARAGTGKTTTILEGITHSPDRKILLAAFNKSIATELQRKLRNPNAEAKTLHSLGFSLVRYNTNGVQLDDRNTPWDEKRERLLARNAIAELSKSATCPKDVVTMVAKVMTLAREMHPFCEDPEDLVNIAYAFNHVPDKAHELLGWNVARVAQCALKALHAAKKPPARIDFTDMLFLPVVNGWAKPYYDLVCVDEAQDMNACQLILAQRVCKADGRIVVVGDDRQAIYGFRGADSNSLDRLKGELDANELGLTTTYRCPVQVVQEANRLVQDYDHAPNAPQGTISRAMLDDLPDVVKPGDFILSRTNAPLMKVCLDLLRNNIRAKIQGKDLGKRLQTIINKLTKKNHYMSVDDFVPILLEWSREESTKLVKADREGQAAIVQDQTATIKILCEGQEVVKDVLYRIDDLFGEPAQEYGVVVCSTVHKAKGLEAPRVFILRETFYPGRRDKMSKRRLLEESNIEYVAITRTMEELIWVTGLM